MRKSRKEDQIFKRRNINEDDMTSPVKEGTTLTAPQMCISDIVASMQSDYSERQYVGMQMARRMLSRERNPPIDIMISHGIVPICVSFLQKFEE